MFRGVIAPGVGIVVVATAIGLTFNAARDHRRIEIGRDYFQATSIDRGRATPSSQPRGPVLPEPAARRDAGAELAARAAAEFRVVDGRVAKALFDQSSLGSAPVLFVDARDDAHYRAGHVPGALKLDYFALRADVEPVLPWLRHVPWLVVYCESSECEDGFLLCRALRDEFRIPADRIMLHLGGMREWRGLGLPVAEGAPR